MHSTPMVLVAALLTATALGQSASFVPLPTVPLGGSVVFDGGRQIAVVFEASARRMWHWDGSEFRLQVGPTPPFGGGAAAYDPVRGEVILDGNIWNGANWRSIGVPTGWLLGAMAYDVARQRLVRVFTSGTPDVAEWDGSQWSRIVPPASPGFGGSLVYDPARGACVLAMSGSSGSPLSLWSWDGSQWTLLDAGGPPATWRGFALAHDPVANRLVVHGPTGNPAVPGTWAFAAGAWTSIPTPSEFLADTPMGLAWDGVGLLRLGTGAAPEGVWRLEGNTWRLLPFAAPGQRTAPALASTPNRPGIVLFGGVTPPHSGARLLGDTWVFDRTWMRMQPQNSPPPRRGAGIAWSPANLAFLLFGGADAQNAVLTDTWLWNGTDWLPQIPSTSPDISLQIVTDPAGGVLGLRREIIGSVNDQWQWSGSNWANTPGPSATYNGALVKAGYDPRRNVVVAVINYELWEWNGVVWTLRGPLSPPYLTPSSVVYRPDTQRMLMFANPGVEWDGSTWFTASSGNQQVPEALASDFRRSRLFGFQVTSNSGSGWNGVSGVLTATPSSARRSGFGCSLGATPALLGDGSPVCGDAGFGVTATTFAPNAPTLLVLGFQVQGQHLGLGCVAWLPQPPAVHLLLTDANGTARLSLPIPNDLSLRAVTFAGQVAVLDPVRGLFEGLTFSDVLTLTIGD
ncbi:MAG: hypothetical protein JNK49_11400 [Planctomycetes bacterium]|nr:hypothetical protein [Planctomycetota bacterium]